MGKMSDLDIQRQEEEAAWVAYEETQRELAESLEEQWYIHQGIKQRLDKVLRDAAEILGTHDFLEMTNTIIREAIDKEKQYANGNNQPTSA